MILVLSFTDFDPRRDGTISISEAELTDVERNARAGDSWRNRWDSLRLFTPARYSGLPGMAVPGSPSSYPTKDETADYLANFRRITWYYDFTNASALARETGRPMFVIFCRAGSIDDPRTGKPKCAF